MFKQPRFFGIEIEPKEVNLTKKTPVQTVNVMAIVAGADRVIMDGELQLELVDRDHWAGSFTLNINNYPQGIHIVSKTFEATSRSGRSIQREDIRVFSEGGQSEPPKVNAVILDPNPVILSEIDPVVYVNIEVNASNSDTVSLYGEKFSRIVKSDTFMGSKRISLSEFPESKVIELMLEISGEGGNIKHFEELAITVAGYETVDTETVNSISLTANINANVIEDRGNYGLRGGGFNIMRGKEFLVNYNLPMGSINLPVGTINAVLPDGSSGGFFEPTMSISVDKEGNLSSNITMNGSDVVASIDDNQLLAQEVIWDTENRTSTITPSSDDKLNSVVNADDVANYYASQLSTISNSYNFNVLQYWNFEITPIEPKSNSIVSSYAAINKRTASNMFLNGEHIVLSTTYPYSVRITDMNGVEQTIVSNTDIHAIVYHHDEAPPLQ